MFEHIFRLRPQVRASATILMLPISNLNDALVQDLLDSVDEAYRTGTYSFRCVGSVLVQIPQGGARRRTPKLQKGTAVVRLVVDRKLPKANHRNSLTHNTKYSNKANAQTLTFVDISMHR